MPFPCAVRTAEYFPSGKAGLTETFILSNNGEPEEFTGTGFLSKFTTIAGSVVSADRLTVPSNPLMDCSATLTEAFQPPDLTTNWSVGDIEILKLGCWVWASISTSSKNALVPQQFSDVAPNLNLTVCPE